MKSACTLAKVLAGLAVVALMSLPAGAQSKRELDLIGKLGGDKPSTSPADQKNHKKLSPEEALRVRILEIESGARTLADLAPADQAIVGPPLDEREAIVHVLGRLAYGPRPGQVEQLLAEGGWESWVSRQLDPDSIDDSELEYEVAKRFPWEKMNMTQLSERVASMCDYKTGCDRPNCPGKHELYTELPELVLFRAAKSKRQFKEVMVDFWRNHFFADQHLVSKRMVFTVADYEKNVIRKHAFGNFYEMLHASATHPAMLEYLDNWISRKGNWNENYARELMELHTLGADRFYNENDITELSKVLTGWTFNANYQFVFKPDQHEPGNKVVVGRNVPQGRDGGEYVLKMLATHRGTAQFISYKLCRYLVNDIPPHALVSKVAAVFNKTNGDLKKVYEAIITSPEFMSRGSFKSKFKTPFEYTVSALRATDAQMDDLDKTAQFVADMGEQIYACPDPTGYYDQAEAWLDSGVLTRRWDFAWKLVAGEVHGVRVSPEFFKPFEDLDPQQMKDKLAAQLIGSDMGAQSNDLLNELVKSEGKAATPKVLSIILGSPAFQQQ